MSDGAFPDRLAQLRTRWESDPSSRVFLQLAEEYRHQGRVKEALTVLDKGLQEHPGYLSALVAKGRCHLELREGEAARAVLERVVKQDATQMVANKLLVRAYLETGEPARARERLDLYSLLNDSDPEIADLRRQIKAMDRPKEPVAPIAAMTAEDSPFDLAPAGAAPRAAAPVDDIFDLGLAPAPSRPATEDIFSLEDEIAPPAGIALADEASTDEAPVDDPEVLFPDLAIPASRQRYLTSLASEGIFEIGPVPEPASEVPIPPAPQVAFAMAPIAPPALFPEEPPLPEPVDTSWLEAEPEPLPEPEPARAAEPSATATLGDLYLRQGHLEEAERIFHEVLEREPGNSAARAGLGTIAEARRPVPPVSPIPVEQPATSGELVDARHLLDGFRPGLSGSGTTARKIFLLNRYLNRIRGGRRDVL
jgi:tetratricopeptide (TPR) repeat protein